MLLRTRGYLPHIETPNSSYFITYRLADSLPLSVIANLRAERLAIEQKLKTPAQRASAIHAYRMAVEDSLDAGHGASHLRDDRIAQIVVENWRHFEGTRYELVAWCVMPNHVHVVIHAFCALDRIVQSWKSYTAKRANAILGKSGGFWAREYFDRLIRNETELERTVAYVVGNPARAGLRGWRWVWSSGEPPDDCRPAAGAP